MTYSPFGCYLVASTIARTRTTKSRLTSRLYLWSIFLRSLTDIYYIYCFVLNFQSWFISVKKVSATQLYYTNNTVHRNFVKLFIMNYLKMYFLVNQIRFLQLNKVLPDITRKYLTSEIPKISSICWTKFWCSS